MKIDFKDLDAAMQRVKKLCKDVEVSINLNDRGSSLEISYTNNKDFKETEKNLQSKLKAYKLNIIKCMNF